MRKILFLLLFLFPFANSFALEQAIDNIIVKKSLRRMYLRRGENVVKEYKIALGRDPVGAKKIQGDGKTPEGEYVISGRNPNSSYHLSLRISYPNDDEIAAAEKYGVSAGGDIMIHGYPNWSVPKLFEFFNEGRDWTEGCIAVNNQEIEEIWNLVPNGTKITILP